MIAGFQFHNKLASAEDVKFLHEINLLFSKQLFAN